ncbi:MAG: hypothetical protein WDO13_06695 [Verrucomicrobiota bacterium]
MHDVEEKARARQLEDQFVQAQKMEVVGQLASGIAHDFNNILGIIIGNNDYLMGKLAADDPLHRNAEEIQHAAERAAGVARQLLVFSRNQVVQTVVLDLNEVIEGMDKMPHPPARRAHRALRHPRAQARPHQGRLRLRRADADEPGHQRARRHVQRRQDHGRDRQRTARPRRRAALSRHGARPLRRPDGAGHRHRHDQRGKRAALRGLLHHQAEGQGHRPRLATCQTIARQIGARIQVESEIGRGTTFRIYFPRVDQPLHTTSRLLRAARPPRGTETLLLVEDEAALRRMTCLALGKPGLPRPPGRDRRGGPARRR